jgi:outer membrane usher protein
MTHRHADVSLKDFGKDAVVASNMHHDQYRRAIRMTGLSFGRGIAINPWYLPYSYSAVNASSVVPSAVEVFVNQQRLQQQSVDAGPFSIVNMAGPIGYGEYRVLTKDTLGRVQVSTQPFYNSPEIVAKEFLEYRVDIGQTRKNYGFANYEFVNLAEIGYLRYGATDNLTIGAQAMHSREAASVGIKPAYRVGTLGVINTVLQMDKTGNKLWSIAGEHSSRTYAVRAEYGRADKDYRDVLVDARFPMPLNSLALRGSYRFNGGSLSLSHLRNTTETLGRTVINSLGAQYSVSRNVMLIATASSGRSNGEFTHSVFVGAIINFGGATSLTSATRTPEGTSYQTSVSHSPGAASGFGYEFVAANQKNTTYGQARHLERRRVPR